MNKGVSHPHRLRVISSTPQPKEDVKNNKHAKLNQSSKNKIHRQSHYYCLLNPHGGGLVLQKRRSTFTSLA